MKCFIICKKIHRRRRCKLQWRFDKVKWKQTNQVKLKILEKIFIKRANPVFIVAPYQERTQRKTNYVNLWKILFINHIFNNHTIYQLCYLYTLFHFSIVVIVGAPHSSGILYLGRQFKQEFVLFYKAEYNILLSLIFQNY